MRSNKRFLALLTTVIMIITMFAGIQVLGDGNPVNETPSIKVADLEPGDQVSMGGIMFKVTHREAEDDSTSSSAVTASSIRLIAKDSVTKAAFDVNPTGGGLEYEPTNEWKYSSLRYWLNGTTGSALDVNEETHPPTQAGLFLDTFRPNEINAIEPVSHSGITGGGYDLARLLSTSDVAEPVTVGGITLGALEIDEKPAWLLDKASDNNVQTITSGGISEGGLAVSEQALVFPVINLRVKTGDGEEPLMVYEKDGYYYFRSDSNAVEVVFKAQPALTLIVDTAKVDFGEVSPLYNPEGQDVNFRVRSNAEYSVYIRANTSFSAIGGDEVISLDKDGRHDLKLYADPYPQQEFIGSTLRRVATKDYDGSDKLDGDIDGGENFWANLYKEQSATDNNLHNIRLHLKTRDVYQQMPPDEYSTTLTITATLDYED